ncbi:hypothetical protein BD310DRAFT_242031 [Dichomitus squalens]|uniref:Uncharacterized protein n=1 Tax=Dichomitus squalens TaxID=114155 RepID=A0A4Q9PC69_9APHY|nr:hypothetical protein BD310DRAFT_242031 [Dichomitus squalens]
MNTLTAPALSLPPWAPIVSLGCPVMDRYQSCPCRRTSYSTRPSPFPTSIICLFLHPGIVDADVLYTKVPGRFCSEAVAVRRRSKTVSLDVARRNVERLWPSFVWVRAVFFRACDSVRQPLRLLYL